MHRFIVLLLLALVISCSKSGTVQELKPCVSSTVIPARIAFEQMEEVIRSLYPETRAEVFPKYDAAKVIVVGRDDLVIDTKSIDEMEIPDTLLYVINFNDESGYAVLAADRRITSPVLCVTEKGTLGLKDFEEVLQPVQHETKADGKAFVELNEGFVPALILSSVLSDLRQAREDGERGEEDGGYNGEGGEEGPDTNDNDYPFMPEIPEMGGEVSIPEPLGPYVMTKWGQSMDPFNRYTPSGYPAGCTCIALAQLLVANRSSNTMLFNGVTVDWDDMEGVNNYSNFLTPMHNGSSSGKEQVANLVATLGTSDYLNNQYSGEGTSPTPIFLLDWGGRLEFAMQRLGYSTNREHALFGFTNSMKMKTYDLLRAGYPAIVQGWAFANGSGHTWLIDGYRFVLGPNYGHYFHINWGWFGERDGYYSLGIFNTANGVFPDSIYDEASLLHTGGAIRNYNVDFAIVDYTFE